MTKGFFSYELDQSWLPPHEAFYSTLREQNITDEGYAYCQRLWEEHDIQTMREFLVCYNNCDVKPLCEALKKISDFWSDNNIDILKQGVSIPRITLIYLFATVQLLNENYFCDLVPIMKTPTKCSPVKRPSS